MVKVWRGQMARLVVRHPQMAWGIRQRASGGARWSRSLSDMETRGGDGRLVTDQPPAQADQDRGPRRAPRPRHHLPTCRGSSHGPDGARYPRRDPPIASATAVRAAAILTKTDRKRHDKTVRRAENRRCRARITWVRSLSRPTPGVSATADTARGEEHLFSGQVQATFPSSRRSLGECSLRLCAALTIATPAKRGCRLPHPAAQGLASSVPVICAAVSRIGVVPRDHPNLIHLD